MDVRDIDAVEAVGVVGAGTMGNGIAQVAATAGYDVVMRDIFAALDGLVGEGAVLATNTSTLSVTTIAAATDAPERVVGVHFMNPVPC